MRYQIIFAPQVIEDLKRLPARSRTTIRDAIEIHLRYEPRKTSRYRIKKLQGLTRPEFRLRVEEYRIFYDVVKENVEILAIVPKSKASDWLEACGEKS